MWNHFRPALSMLLIWSVITGIAYPFVVTGIAQTVFPNQANGSLLFQENKAVGSALIGQAFHDPKYFWGRPSATAPMPYNSAASSGSNLGLLNPALHTAVAQRVTRLLNADPENLSAIPVDLVTTSASGLDPHISPASAEYQISRVARARSLAMEAVRELVLRHTEAPQFFVFGDARVNVLELNLALDEVR